MQRAKFQHPFTLRCRRLQIGVKGILGGTTVYWYACPSGGGKVRVGGWS